MTAAITLFLFCAIGLIWLLGILRALYLYFRWLRFQEWYTRLLLLVFANIGPLFLLRRIELLDRSLNLPATVLVVLCSIGGLCMLMYISASGMVHGILLCSAGYQRWLKLNDWYKFLTLGIAFELLLVLTEAGIRLWS